MFSKVASASLAASFVNASFSGPGGHGYGEDCSNFNGNVGCKDGKQTRYPDDWSKRAF